MSAGRVPAGKSAGRPSAERRTALQVLMGSEKGGFSHLLIRDALDRHAELTPAERSFCKRLTEGTIERRAELDGVLARFLKKGGVREPAVRCILRMALYEVLYMDAVPDAAAVSEAVLLVRDAGMPGLAGLVNGVLRAAVRAKEAGELAPAGAAASMPAWIADMWERAYGRDTADALIEGSLRPRPVTVRFDPACSGAEREDILSAISAEGVSVTPARWVAGAYCLGSPGRIASLPGYAEGLWTVQDESSSLAVLAAGISGGERIVDVCAAPGGKSLFAAQILAACGAGGEVFSFDISEKKTAQIACNAARLGLDLITAAVRDARTPDPALAGTADVLFCDLPCSGLGVIGRKGDIKYRVRPEDLAALAALQRQILVSAAAYLRPGGVMIYSTCTLDPAENEENADFIGRVVGLVPDDLAPHLPAGLPGIQGARVTLMPHIHGTDGFFIARYRRPGAPGHEAVPAVPAGERI